MRYHLFQKVFGKMVKIKETSFLLCKCLVSIAHHCIKFSLGVGLLRFAQIFAMERSDIVTLPIFDLRECYLSLFTFHDQVAESN